MNGRFSMAIAKYQRVDHAARMFDQWILCSSSSPPPSSFPLELPSRGLRPFIGALEFTIIAVLNLQISPSNPTFCRSNPSCLMTPKVSQSNHRIFPPHFGWCTTGSKLLGASPMGVGQRAIQRNTKSEIIST